MAKTEPVIEFEKALREGRVSFCLSPSSTLNAKGVYDILLKNADRIATPSKSKKVTMDHLW